MGSHISRKRSSGFIDFFKDREDVKIANIQFDSVNEIIQFLDTRYEEYGCFDGIFSPCFAGHYIGDHLNSLEKKVCIISYDLNEMNRRSLENGTIDCILSQRPESQGYLGVYQLYKKIILQQEVESDVEIQVNIYFKENLPNSDRCNESTIRNVPYFGE